MYMTSMHYMMRGKKMGCFFEYAPNNVTSKKNVITVQFSHFDFRYAVLFLKNALTYVL